MSKHVDKDHKERHSKKCQERTKSYNIRINKEKFRVQSETITGREILELAQKTPFERYLLNQKFKGGQVKPISLNERVDLTEPGIEKFMTITLDINKG